VHDLINLAYWLHPKQFTGGLVWTESEKFDMTGKPDAPDQPNVDQMKMMIQKLLTDRFQLKFHFEKRELPVYAIKIAKNCAKTTRSQDAFSERYDFTLRHSTARGRWRTARPACGAQRVPTRDLPSQWVAE
jgi:uncharacterized protein (TIGR03435 family)